MSRHRAPSSVTRRGALVAGAAWVAGAFAASSGLGGRWGATAAPSAAPAEALAAAQVPPTPAGTPSTPPTASPTTATATASATFDRTAHSTGEASSPWVVVNKQHPIVPADYEPAQVVRVAGELVSAVAAPDLEALLAHSRDDGVALTLVSGFRTHEYQEQVHRRSVARNGQAGADRYSARAGYSEHQTGLAVDFSSADGSATLSPRFGETDEGLWLAEHAGAHGWLLRYTEADQAVTGYNPEPWHFRWVGVELVAAMAAAGTPTLEQFFGVSGGPDYA
ncbi:D-alanyl-D-alanine carboxypeptidase family protein [Streptomyces sp. NP160]|uniref:M15 family metallopeptidase n=1 Tax=Streptomyces sp. NP160 TaxID=2586637 RepID=UPI0011194317|nr:M15 family metallopeptidase [Streptomyces sp. NP160]TNM69963.1 D-alanyl-D-alanine carboxypeptidase family protein [Streptomyces sp. NP160]